ncbi:MAG: hypothetical protein CSA07_05545 [Bacteroidia bacterium]|nr:MAG: hypothetical protein CSA07_05545 [Bacteroidia bacterium]
MYILAVLLTTLAVLVIMAPLGVRTWSGARAVGRRIVLALKGMRFAPDTGLSDAQKRSIAISAALAELYCAYLDSLATGQDLKELREQFSEQYLIDSPRRAFGTIEYCLAGREASLLALVYGAFAIKDEREQRAFLRGVTEDKDEYYEEVLEMVQELERNFDKLRQYGVVETEADILRVGTVGWDATLACWLARCSYDLGYISESEAWGYILRAERMARKTFSSWEEFGKSYMLGRAISTGDISSGIKAIVEDLVEKRKSPWQRYPWGGSPL